MKAYFTGGLGFIGSYLTKELGNYQIENVPHKKIATAKLQPFDTFIFLSTFGNLYNQTNADMIIQANVLDVIAIIRRAVQFPFKSFIFISTSSVKLPVQTMYSRTKRMAEELLLAHLEKYKKPICIIRPYSVCGVGEHKEHLIPTLIRSCYTGELVNFVPGPCHDFIDVTDIVSGILSLMKAEARGIFELGTGKQYSNQEVLEMVEEATGKKANINIINEARAYDTHNWVSTNFRARSFGWLPKKSLKQSIKEMVKAYEQS